MLHDSKVGRRVPSPPQRTYRLDASDRHRVPIFWRADLATLRSQHSPPSLRSTSRVGRFNLAHLWLGLLKFAERERVKQACLRSSNRHQHRAGQRVGSHSYPFSCDYVWPSCTAGTGFCVADMNVNRKNNCAPPMKCVWPLCTAGQMIYVKKYVVPNRQKNTKPGVCALHRIAKQEDAKTNCRLVQNSDNLATTAAQASKCRNTCKTVWPHK